MLKWIAAPYHHTIQGCIIEKGIIVIAITITQKVQYSLTYIIDLEAFKFAFQFIWLCIKLILKKGGSTSIELGNQWVDETPIYSLVTQNWQHQFQWIAMKSKRIPAVLRTKISLHAVRCCAHPNSTQSLTLYILPSLVPTNDVYRCVDLKGIDNRIAASYCSLSITVRLNTL